MARVEYIQDDDDGGQDGTSGPGQKFYECRNCLRMLPYDGDTPPSIVECHGARRTKIAGPEPGMAEHVLTWPEAGPAGCDCRRRAVASILRTCAEGDASLRTLAETIAANVDRVLGGDGSDLTAERVASEARRRVREDQPLPPAMRT